MEPDETYRRAYRLTVATVKYGTFEKVAADEKNVDAALAGYERATHDIVNALVRLLDDFNATQPGDSMGRRQDPNGG